MQRVAVFIDAGYFWVQVSTLVLGVKGSRTSISIDYTKLRASVLKEAAAQFPDANLLRIYWYDGPGQNGKTSEHFAIERLDDFKLRLGTRNGQGAQKAVDGLILTDMISLAQSKSISDAMLVSGDADMVPGVAASQAIGIRVHLLSIGPSAATSPHLAAEVDRKVAWTGKDVAVFAKPASISTPAASSPVSAGAPSPALTTPVTTSNAVVLLPFTSIAQTVHANISSGANAALLTGLHAKSVHLPKEIDIELLRAMGTHVKRLLTEQEKRQVRVEFKKLLLAATPQ